MELDIYGILLVFLFGLRHGLAADHIAVIDGLGMHLSRNGKHRIVPWLGTLFALGHGMVIILFITLTNQGVEALLSGHYAFHWLEWFPVGLLFMIAFLNLRTLLLNKPHVHCCIKLYKGSNKKGNSLTTILIGVSMIMIFDTLSDAAAWGYSAASKGSIFSALVIGAIFTIGMIITDTIDSRLLAKTIQRSFLNEKVLRQRRLLSWVIVIFSLSIGVQKMLSIINPAYELSEMLNLWLGLLLVLSVAISYIKIYRTLPVDISPAK